MARDINPGAGNSNIAFPVDANGTLFFVANDGSNGRELWTSNGRVYGTYLVQDISPAFGNANPTTLTASGNLLFFVADDGVSGPELWAADVIFDSSFEFLAPPG